MSTNAKLARAIGWPQEQIDGDAIVIDGERFPFDFNDPLVIEPIKEKYRPEVIANGDTFWAHVPGSAMQVAPTANRQRGCRQGRHRRRGGGVMWKAIAWFVSKPAVADWLIKRAQRTPYLHLEGYMNRWWLFNPTPPLNGGRGRRFEWLPSIRIHHILRADQDRHEHNHPWDARTIILKGCYVEQRGSKIDVLLAGDTRRIDADTFHRIRLVSQGGVWTLFISWKYQHTWGFKTEEGFVPWREYLGEDK